MNSEPSPLVLTNQDKRLEMSGFVLTQTLRPSGTSGRADTGVKLQARGRSGACRAAIGFDGWQALKSGADAMTDKLRQTTPIPILSSVSAQLFVANIKSSCDFYTNKLGFAVEIHLWRSAILGAGHPRQCATRLEAGLRTCVRCRCSQARTSALRFHHG
jgi:hypothetical protein